MRESRERHTLNNPNAGHMGPITGLSVTSRETRSATAAWYGTGGSHAWAIGLASVSGGNFDNSIKLSNLWVHFPVAPF